MLSEPVTSNDLQATRLGPNVVHRCQHASDPHRDCSRIFEHPNPGTVRHLASCEKLFTRE